MKTSYELSCSQWVCGLEVIDADRNFLEACCLIVIAFLACGFHTPMSIPVFYIIHTIPFNGIYDPYVQWFRSRTLLWPYFDVEVPKL